MLLFQVKLVLPPPLFKILTGSQPYKQQDSPISCNGMVLLT